jgi:DNA-binding protein HU-beta
MVSIYRWGGDDEQMYKSELVRRVAREERLSQRVVNDALTTALKLIQHTLATGQTVTLPGFGTFYTSKRSASKVKHIRTGKEITVPARRVAAFRAGELLKKAVRGKK